MSFLSKLLSGIFTDMLGKFFYWITDFFKVKKEREDLSKKNRNQAEIVDALSKQIQQLMREGKPVPQELKDKLREESRILISGTFD